MHLEAVVIRSLGVQSGTSKAGNPWEKASIVVETQGQYPKKIALSNMKRAQEFAALPIGSMYKFGIDIESREFNGRFYTDVSAYSWEQVTSAQTYAQPQPQQYTQPQYGQPYVAQSQDDGMPF